MCGRAACTLAPKTLRQKFAYTRKRADKQTDAKSSSHPSDSPCQDVQEPAFVDEGCKYQQSYNTTPKQYLPVLLQTKDGHREFRVMQWGLVPSWHKGSDPSTFSLSMFNARLDGIADKASFRTPLKRGQRCVVVMDGFFEWQVLPSKRRQPYFVYFKDSGNDSRCGQDPEHVEGSKASIRPLTIAGIYDTWTPTSKDDDGSGRGSESSSFKQGLPAGASLETFTIITVPAAQSLTWLHDRMPAVLETSADVDAWLDHGTVPAHEALSRLVSAETALSWHPVGKQVGNIRSAGADCIVEVDPVPVEEKQRAKLASGMAAWLKTGSCSPSKKTSSKRRSAHSASQASDGVSPSEPLAKVIKPLPVTMADDEIIVLSD
eukprot:m.197369 g.197369  ORF g.197369 m.197369 type:complete len:375 (-) comp17023_c0_seq7:29-1153(-)